MFINSKFIIFGIFMLILTDILLLSCRQSEKTYLPKWESLVKHQPPEWFDDAKFGIYVHWGLYSVPAYETEWYARHMYVEQSNVFQYHKEHFGDQAEFGFKDFIPMFKAENFNADEWAELFKKAGARFAGLVVEHHDGFAMWDSKLTKWNASNMGPKRDISAELSAAIKSRGMKFITTFHHACKWWWYEATYTPDKRYDTQDPQYAGLYPQPHEIGAPPPAKYMQEWEDKIVEVIDKYQPDILYFDGQLGGRKYFRSASMPFETYKKRMIAHYYNSAIECGKEVVLTYKFTDLPPGAGLLDIERGRFDYLREEKWLTDTSIDNKAWCYISNPRYKSADDIIDILVDIVSKNGNLLLSIGPRADGTIPEEQKQRLLAMGEWLQVNGEAIYGTRPWKIYGEGPTAINGGYFGEKKDVIYTAEDIRFTVKDSNLYAICLDNPASEVMIRSLKDMNPNLINSINLLGMEKDLSWSMTNHGLSVRLPEEFPGQFAHTLKISLTVSPQDIYKSVQQSTDVKSGKAFVYVSNYDDGTISLFILDRNDGNLFSRGKIEVGSQPGPLTVNQKQSILYATVRGENSVSAFKINPKSGELSLRGSTEVAGNPAYISLDRSGKYLFTAYYRDEKISVQKIEKNSLVGRTPVQVISTAKNPHAILSDYSNRFVFVPHTGANNIFQFLFDSATGRLESNESELIVIADSLQPRHIFFHPQNKWVYMSNEKGCSVSAYELNSERGTLEVFQTLSTLPDDFAGVNTCADIEVHPTGKFVYVSNRGHNSIASFTVDEETGELTLIEYTPTEDTPRSFNIDLSGRFLLAAGQKTNTLVSYRIDSASGKLQKIYVYPVGKDPSWVEIVAPDQQ